MPDSNRKSEGDEIDAAKLLELELKQNTILYNRGLAFLNKDELTLAIADLTSCIKNDSNDIKPYQLRAKAYRKLGKISEAEADEKKVAVLGR